MIRIAICGTRHWVNQDIINRTVAYMARFDAMLVSGGKPKPGYHNNVDEWAEDAADLYDVPKAIFPAQWDFYAQVGRRNFAGPARNVQIAEFANVGIFFWDGKSRGTRNCIEQFDQSDKPTLIISPTDPVAGIAFQKIPEFIRLHAIKKAGV